MGKRVHVVKKQEEYGNYEAFNWEWASFHSFLDLLGCDVCSEDEYSDRFTCEVGAFKVALDALKSYNKSGLKSKKMRDLMSDFEFDNEDLDSSLSKLGGLENVIYAMEAFWEERDKKSGDIEFVAF